MELGDLLVILTAGFFATYVHLILALWAGRVGRGGGASHPGEGRARLFPPV